MLDLRAGTLTRTARWRSPAGKQVLVRSTRLVSLTQRSVVAIEYVVEAVDEFTRVTVQSELVANEDQPQPSADPRVAAMLRNPLESVAHETADRGALLIHRTRGQRSDDGRGDGPPRRGARPRRGGHRCGRGLGPHHGHLRSAARSEAAHREVPRPTAGRACGRGLRCAIRWLAASRAPATRAGRVCSTPSARYLDDFWDSADVEVEGDPDIQQAVRFGLFHVLQASARAERRAIPGKGLTGTGYDGHAFWDTEGYVLPLLTYTAPEAAADALRWRASTLGPRARAGRRTRPGGRGVPVAHHRGRGMLGVLAGRHRGLARQRRHRDGVRALPRGHRRRHAGSRMRAGGVGRNRPAVDCRLATTTGTAVWHLDGVTGPDEYTAVVRDNVFTNLMAANNLRIAAQACERHPVAAQDMGVTTEEMAAWRDAAAAVHIPYDDELGVHEQCEGFTTLREWNFTENTEYPLLLHEAYVRLYPAQVVKQADLVLAMHWQGHAFTPEQKARNVDYYERRTTRDSSLSACTQAVLCAEVGHLELAHDYAYETAVIDLRDLHHNTRDGLHMASLAGAWTALVAGFGGLRDDEGCLCLDPQLPDGISRLRFRLRWRRLPALVDVDHDQVSYTLRDGPDGELTIRHGGKDVTLSTQSPTTVALAPQGGPTAAPTATAGPATDFAALKALTGVRSRRRCGSRRSPAVQVRRSARRPGRSSYGAVTAATRLSNGARSPSVAAVRASSTRWLRGM